MRVTEKDVLHVADLASLELTEQERARLARDLNSILEYIDRLNELDTSNVAPMAQVAGNEQTVGDAAGFADAMRRDELRASLAQEAVLANAPDSDGKFFKVPRVIEK